MQNPDNRQALQIIVGTLAMGIAVFLGVVWFLQQSGRAPEPGPTTPLLSNLAAGLLGANLLVRAVLRRFIPFRQFIVIGAALIEGAGLFGCVAYLLEGTGTALTVAAVSIPLIFMLQFPTQERWEIWARAAGERDEFGSDYDV